MKFWLILLLSFGISLKVAAQPFNENLTISDDCQETIKTMNINEYILDQSQMLPPISKRQDVTKLILSSVDFRSDGSSKGIDGLLIETRDSSFLHCFTHWRMPTFVLAERTKQLLIFQSEEVDVTEVHIHYEANCGTGCKNAWVETIMFADRTHDYHLGLSTPYLFKVISTEPNHYPSKYFRAYLTDTERKLWDDSLG